MQIDSESKGALGFLRNSSSPSVIHILAPHSAVQPVWPEFLTSQADQTVRVLLIDDDPHISRVIAHELLADLRIDLVGQGASE